MKKKKKMFDKYEIKNIIIEALTSRDVNSCLKKEFQTCGRDECSYYDIVYAVSEQMVNTIFEE